MNFKDNKLIHALDTKGVYLECRGSLLILFGNSSIKIYNLAKVPMLSWKTTSEKSAITLPDGSTFAMKNEDRDLFLSNLC